MLRAEPSAGIGGSISLVMAAAFAVLKASGVELTDDMTGAIEALVWALCAVPFVTGFLTRFFVVSPQTAATAVIRAKKDVSPTPTVPEINVVGGAYDKAVEAKNFRTVPPPVNP